jgi:4-hydroxybenzoate polyprenyltransferase
MFFSLPFHNNLIFLIIMIMLIHLLFIFFYSFLYKRNEKVGMIFEIVSIVINILMGLAVLSAIGSV